MPLYTYDCPECEKRQTLFRKIIERDETAICPRCQEEMKRILEAPRVVPDYPEYECPVSGDIIRGRRQHEENLRKHGCRVLEPGESEAFRRRKQAESAAEDEAFGETAAEIVAAMPDSKRQQLETELSHGADTAITRA